MSELEVFKLAARSCRIFARETFLIVCAVAAGVWALGLSQGVLSNAKGKILQKVDSMGKNCICIFPSSNKGGARAIEFSEYRALEKEFSHAFGSKVILTPMLVYRYRTVSDKSPEAKFFNVITCMESQGFSIGKHELCSGRFFDKADRYRKVCVVGSAVAKNFGDRVTFDGLTFSVIGVLTHVAQVTQSNPNEMVFIPFGLANVLLNDTKTIHEVVLSLQEENLFEQAILLANECLKRLRKVKCATDKDWTIFDHKSFRQTSLATTKLLEELIIFFALITMALCFLACCNCMLFNIKIRQPEIQIMLKIGASETLVFKQFLYECLIRFVGGLFCGVLLCVASARGLKIDVFNSPYSLPLILLYIFIISVVSVFIAALATRENF